MAKSVSSTTMEKIHGPLPTNYVPSEVLPVNAGLPSPAMPDSTALPQMTIVRWYHAMCQAGQPPMALCIAGFGLDPKQKTPIHYHYQVGCDGRAYDDDSDRPLWNWMRQHKEGVIEFLIALGRCHVLGYGAHRTHSGRMRPADPKPNLYRNRSRSQTLEA